MQTPSRKPLTIGPLTIDPPVLQAPMAGFTNYAYRHLVRRLGGVGLPATEMISARACFFGAGSRRPEDKRATRGPSAEPREDSDQFLGELPERLWGVRDEPRPLAVQIWDNSPEQLAAVGAWLVREFHVSVVDLNFGCPVRDVSEKAQSGSYLLRDPERVGQIVAHVVAACAPVPVTAKIRLGPSRDWISAGDVAQAVEAAGGAAITVHGRTAADLFRGRADWDEIARIKCRLRKIPLIGNGDLRTAAEVVRAFDRYGVDGVMIGRAGLSRPWLFRQAAAALRGEAVPPEPDLDQQRQLLLEHYELIARQFGPRKGTVLMRKYACCYAQGHRGARAFRAAIAQVATPEDFREAVGRYFPQGDHGSADACSGR